MNWPTTGGGNENKKPTFCRYFFTIALIVRRHYQADSFIKEHHQPVLFP